jgi:hypothetical protein
MVVLLDVVEVAVVSTWNPFSRRSAAAAAAVPDADEVDPAEEETVGVVGARMCPCNNNDDDIYN